MVRGEEWARGLEGGGGDMSHLQDAFRVYVAQGDSTSSGFRGRSSFHSTGVTGECRKGGKSPSHIHSVCIVILSGVAGE